jgi:2-methylcitrate dehydratase PrpD
MSRESIALEIRRLAEWAAATPLAALPRETLVRAARVVADDLAAITGARNEPEVKQFHERVLARATRAESTVFRGGRQRTDRLNAAVANAVAADWLELDEGFRPASCHAGLYVLPALLAEAEASNLSFGEMLRALVLGYEIVTRVALSFPQKSVTMQSHGRFAAVGAAAGVALARKADARLLCAALGTAATLIGPSPRTHLAAGILSRNVWPAAGAWSGAMAVDWAECGIAGAPEAFHDVYATVLGNGENAGALSDGLGQRWSILEGYTKIYACCQHLHAAVEAAVAMRPGLLAQAPLDEVAAIRVETHPLAIGLVNARPETTLGAKFSMSHAVAAALVTGTGGAAAFEASTLADQAIDRLRNKLTVSPWSPELPPPNDRPSRVIVELRDGRKLQGECLSAVGGPDRPLPPETVFEKITALAAPVYPKMRPLLEELATLPAPRLARGWSDLVGEFCG